MNGDGRSLWIACVFLFSVIATLQSCAKKVAVVRPAGPLVPATVLTMRTIVPGEKGLLHLVVIAGSQVRLGNESGRWRLIDVDKRTVTFVDEVEKTYVTRSLQELIRAREKTFDEEIPPSIPRAQIEPTGEREISGIPCRNYRVTMGKYRRDLCLSTKPIAGKSFLALYTASSELDSHYAPAMRTVFAKLTTLEGFPLFDHGEMPFGDDLLLIETMLVKAEQKRVPAKWVTVPADFRDASEPARATSPGAGPRPASSAPRDRTSPAEE